MEPLNPTLAPILTFVRREYRRTGCFPSHEAILDVLGISISTVRRHLADLDATPHIVRLGHGARTPRFFRLLVAPMPACIEGAEMEGAEALEALRDAFGGVDPVELRVAVDGAVDGALIRSVEALHLSIEAGLALRMILQRDVEPKCQHRVWAAVQEIVDGAMTPQGVIARGAEVAAQLATEIFTEAALQAARGLPR